MNKLTKIAAFAFVLLLAFACEKEDLLDRFASNDQDNYVSFVPDRNDATDVENERPGVMSTVEMLVGEGSRTMTLTVRANRASNTDRTVNVSVQFPDPSNNLVAGTNMDAAGYDVPTSVTIPAGQLEGTFDVTFFEAGLSGTETELVLRLGETESLSAAGAILIIPAKIVCGGTEVTLDITFDDYPGETSWEITQGGTVLASGGPYGGSGVSTTICLGSGSFSFTIFDAYGDGICCAYGNGSYSLTNDSTGATIASGGAFGSSETTTFTLP